MTGIVSDILYEVPGLVLVEHEVTEAFGQYVDAITPEEPAPRKLDTKAACERLFGPEGLLAARGLMMVVTAPDRLRMYERPEVTDIYTPEGVDYWGGFILAISGTLERRRDGLDADQFLTTPGGTILKAEHLGQDIKRGEAQIIPARAELALRLNDKPLRKSPISTMDGKCGSCTQFNCRHGRFAWLSE